MYFRRATARGGGGAVFARLRGTSAVPGEPLDCGVAAAGDSLAELGNCRCILRSRPADSNRRLYSGNGATLVDRRARVSLPWTVSILADGYRPVGRRRSSADTAARPEGSGGGIFPERA